MRQPHARQRAAATLTQLNLKYRPSFNPSSRILHFVLQCRWCSRAPTHHARLLQAVCDPPLAHESLSAREGPEAVLCVMWAGEWGAAVRGRSGDSVLTHLVLEAGVLWRTPHIPRRVYVSALGAMSTPQCACSQLKHTSLALCGTYRVRHTGLVQRGGAVLAPLELPSQGPDGLLHGGRAGALEVIAVVGVQVCVEYGFSAACGKHWSVGKGDPERLGATEVSQRAGQDRGPSGTGPGSVPSSAFIQT